MFFSAPPLEVCDLGKAYSLYASPAHRLLEFIKPAPKQQTHQALAGVSFSLARGETLAIIGRNGAGKSTLLQLICGTLTPTSGRVHVNGRIAALLELGAGFNPDFTGRENVYLNASLHGLSRDQIVQRMDLIREFADIGDHFEQPVRTYSSGMVVRLAFAALAHVDADILIIDEALAVGDAFFVQKCMRFLREFQTRASVLLVSHDSAAVAALADRAIWLDGGRIHQIGPAKEVGEAYLAQTFGQQAANSQPEPGAFGVGGAAITETHLLSATGKPLSLVTGGESASVHIYAQATKPLRSPILGFYVKDRLGQNLFGDNTWLKTADCPVVTPIGGHLHAEFHFIMPRLATGTYTIAVALADGTQETHDAVHWIHDALAFQVTQSHGAGGLVGIPMQSICLNLTVKAE